ncbi:hypothetical protein [Paraburkholderia adhaesiva]|uniref:hypothetical protein n=1 Tax=Paraburkholderia adhaesiva TaxID=2883244 RepID=UPI001F3C440A|nr:hypothetical protein [Paraburkholderia adhaesiva]
MNTCNSARKIAFFNVFRDAFSRVVPRERMQVLGYLVNAAENAETRAEREHARQVMDTYVEMLIELYSGTMLLRGELPGAFNERA